MSNKSVDPLSKFIFLAKKKQSIKNTEGKKTVNSTTNGGF